MAWRATGGAPPAGGLHRLGRPQCALAAPAEVAQRWYVGSIGPAHHALAQPLHRHGLGLDGSAFDRIIGEGAVDSADSSVLGLSELKTLSAMGAFGSERAASRAAQLTACPPSMLGLPPNPGAGGPGREEWSGQPLADTIYPDRKTPRIYLQRSGWSGWSGYIMESLNHTVARSAPEKFRHKSFLFKTPLSGVTTLTTLGFLRVCGPSDPDQKAGWSGCLG